MSDYSGNVRVGGPADTREINGITLTKIAVGPYDNNAYLLRSAATGEQVLIDAASDSAVLLNLTGEQLAAVITTHQHGDHWQALAPVVEATGAATYTGRADADGIPVPTDHQIDDGDTIRIGDIELTAIHLVGHTPGSIALLLQPDGAALTGEGPHLFTGDCLFPGGPGRTTTPEAFNSLMSGLEERVFGRLPDETWIYPGHGNDTTLGAERPHLAEWRARGW
jgi:glyoxylase-like metal-dependent hydrolase (beta-lactamase superfamily II)